MRIKLKDMKNPASIRADEREEIGQMKSRPLWLAEHKLGQKPL